MPLLSRLAVQAARAYGMLVGSSANNVPVTYLVVAGGGSGGNRGNRGGGGGGGGGFLTSTATLSTLNTYSITVGAGGAGTTSSDGNIGSNSVISGTGLTTITSTGGGFGGASTGGNGGSGGGGSGDGQAGGNGTSGQGNNGGAGFNTGGTSGRAGGGGGANATGSNATSSNGGNGGAGTASSISGSSVTYAGGGGGAVFNGGTPGTGGAGGGTAGAANSTFSSAAGANTGGGSGGGSHTTVNVFDGGSGNGGSGIVIISYASAFPRFVGGTLTTSGGNQIHTFTSSGTLSPITPITASYLVVAGGGGAGRTVSGGGGGGGYLTSSTTLYSGATYVVTVGGGGAVGATLGARGTNGGNSVISGTGLTTITSLGGGGGGADGTGTVAERSGNSGGSGGGAVNVNGVPGAGTSGQGNAGGNGSTNCAGGGGGAGAVGGNGSGNIGGTGGNGLQSSISGTATYYAGGGGGGGYNTASTNAGGLGGGGNGTNDATNSTPGTPNSGGGGGGAGFTGAPAGTSASGGSGIVIISYAGSQQFNGGLVTTSGGNTIHTFTSTGALTPLTNNLNNSLRFRQSANAHLTRTPASTTNQRTWTFSAWIKRGLLNVENKIFGAGTSGSNVWYLMFADGGSGDLLTFGYWNGATHTTKLTTTQVFRDPSAWYHITLAVDTTQATAANRIKMYVNGNQITAFNTSTYPAQNTDTLINSSGATQYIGNATSPVTTSYDGYMADINFIDGQALEPYFFGNNDANGVWKPIQYRGTYGTNGFYLNFSNTTSTTTLGFDSSPNGNNWTCNNISLTAGSTYDAMTDVPTNTSATTANYCVLSPLDFKSVAPQQANSYVPATDYAFVRGTFWASTGKWYYEWTSSAGGGLPPYVGVAAANITSYLGVTTSGISWYGHSDAYIKPFTATASVAATALTAGDIIGVAFDCDAGTIRYYKNNTLVYTDSTLTVGTLVSPVLLSTFGGGAWNNATFNFGQRPFAYTPPTGYLALNTFNLPNPTILQGNRFMDATLWSGNNATTNIVNQGQFRPDFVWIKNRNTTNWHMLSDSVRGVGKNLFSNVTDAEGTNPGFGYLNGFNSNGFLLTPGSSSSDNVNATGNTYVGWQWQAGQGTTSSNTSGTITSTVSASTTAGFSVATFSSNSTNATIGHGLGVAPKMIIVKGRNNVQDWYVYHSSLGAGNYILLNGTGASQANTNVWQNTTPTSSIFYFGSSFGTVNYVAYCWAEIAGFSRFGSYVGNGSSPGPFVYLGFRPEFIMAKSTSTNRNWIMFDATRSPFNTASARLFANTSGAESTNEQVLFLSNGFQMTTNTFDGNTNGETYIYMAFAEHPFKNANAR